MEIRAATPEDIAEIAPFFRAIVADGESYTYPEGLTDLQIRDAWLAPQPGHTIVAVVDGAIVGTARMGPNKPGRGDHVGTASFMVDPGASARGVGRAMAQWVIDWHRENGYRAIQFNAVVETNTRAVALWQDLGFRIIGTVPKSYRSRRHGLVGLHIMYLEL
ncbi:GCN5 family acetyltransferase [Mycolicibacterium conceptionense]|uniref:GCN5 family acetyltransferase n=3 Tax=Mycolicibacterium TaxID=1866885 RepID=A0ABR5FY89_9MYCO|nr:MULTISPECIES: GNAT family N-acetyltransferase [Mycolicibacterium]KLI09002.1 GCN5 family acetyltransferase [Mycolicibacterium senegalense]KLO52922.1 GCN5 family acetyltransferase [Mycolicibacterium senegalense]MCW1823587.1 GNAT family N-acetyltransferase [Mycolicibacterium senegalense]OBB10094.1 GCN5 family acetyltransferase [Mycolicibacterium conceptionense]OBF08954.1 GCN5 family acetyltransferase [Mycolicibacterium conceptionense]